MKGRSSQIYAYWANSLKQHLSNAFPDIKFKIVGSGDDTFKRTGDINFKICFEGGQTSQEKIYPVVIAELNSRTKGKTVGNERFKEIKMGKSENVIDVYPEKKGGKISFALVPCDKFQ